MNGIHLEIEENNKYLDLIISPAEAPEKLKAKAIIDLFNSSAFSNLFLFEENVQNAVAAVGQAGQIEPLGQDMVQHAAPGHGIQGRSGVGQS